MTTKTGLRPLPNRSVFIKHVAERIVLATGVLAVSLCMGTVGYHSLERLSWVDALLNASMILAGMGPVDHVETTAGKLFASAYALFSGVVFLSAVAIMLTPLAKRMLHRLHLDMRETE